MIIRRLRECRLKHLTIRRTYRVDSPPLSCAVLFQKATHLIHRSARGHRSFKVRRHIHQLKIHLQWSWSKHSQNLLYPSIPFVLVISANESLVQGDQRIRFESVRRLTLGGGTVFCKASGEKQRTQRPCELMVQRSRHKSVFLPVPFEEPPAVVRIPEGFYAPGACYG